MSKDHQFKPGVSGNPAGRPKGSKNRITLLKQVLEVELREKSQGQMAGVLEKAIELALQGDRSMIKLLLDLHMTKGHSAEERATEKVEINITTTGDPKKAEAEQAEASPVTEELKNG